jgi:GT2 family glycosyltransferase
VEKINPAQIFHLPRILYHAGSGPATRNLLPRAQAEQDFGRMALEDYRQRNHIPGSVQKGTHPGTYRLQRKLTASPKVAIIIPFRDKVQLLVRCLTSIMGKTDYPHYEIMLVDNQSREPETLAYLQQLSHNRNIRVLAYNQAFNFSAINNFAVAHTDRKYLLFLNNDTEIISPGWLRAMLEHITREEVGVVGAKLLYPNQTIQHGGVVMGIMRICDHPYRYFPADHPGYFGQLQVVRNCSAVTGACLLTRKSLFQAVGGFEAEHLPVALNDIDLCLKILEKGYLVVWTPYALLYHHEYSSRGDDRESREKYIRSNAEMAYMEKKWGHSIDYDPYYNPNLTRLFENYGF